MYIGVTNSGISNLKPDVAFSNIAPMESKGRKG
jgi:hypothetical protein